MPKFFVKEEQIAENSISIVGDDARHIARSLRMAVGDGITVSDGKATDYLCRLTKIRDEECECEIVEASPSQCESPIAITLCMAYPKGDKLETIIQKAVELGATRILPFESSRCIKRPKAEKLDKQLQRLSRIAEEAAKQCGRSRIPEVLPPTSFAEMLKIAKESELALLCYENETGYSIKDAFKDNGSAKSISVIVGSEGGFSPEEAKSATDAGCVSISLGKRILRCETAPSFVLSAISYNFEI